MAIAKGVDLSTMVIRSVHDPDDVTFPADAELQIVAEYTRRRPPSTTALAGSSPTSVSAAPAPGASSPENQALELAFNGTVKDGVLNSAGLTMLASLALTLGLAAGLAEGASLVRGMAQARQVLVRE
jgi:hypothetical protein